MTTKNNSKPNNQLTSVKQSHVDQFLMTMPAAMTFKKKNISIDYDNGNVDHEDEDMPNFGGIGIESNFYTHEANTEAIR